MRQGDIEGAVEMQSNIDMITSSKDEAKSNIDDYQKQLRDVEAQGDQNGKAEILGALANAYADRYEWDAAISNYLSSLETFERLGDLFCAAQTMVNMSMVYRDQGDWDRAIALLNQSLEIFNKLNAIPCQGMVKQNLGVIYNMKGCDKDAETHLLSAMTTFENLGAGPDLSESYLAISRFKTRVNLLTQAKFYLSQAETVIYRIDYKPLLVQLYNAWGDLYYAEQFYSESSINYHKALDLSRMLGNPHEEARTLRNLGLLAASQKNYEEADARLADSMAFFERLGAVHDVLLVYYDIASLALARRDYSKAEEVALLLVNQSKIARYVDINIRALVALADCEINTDRQKEAMEDCSRALELTKSNSNDANPKTVRLLVRKVIECIEAVSSKNPAPQDHAFRLMESLKSKLNDNDFRNLLEIVPDTFGAVQGCRLTL
jgi:tetratricopeptide (TPR) repeat protein